MNRVIIHYAATYEQMVDDMEAGGLPTNASLRSEARRLDKQLKDERQG